MQTIREITWREVTGNKFNRALHLAMLSPEKYRKQVQIRRVGDTRKSVFYIEYDKEYALFYIANKILKPLEGIELPEILKLIKEADELRIKVPYYLM